MKFFSVKSTGALLCACLPVSTICKQIKPVSLASLVLGLAVFSSVSLADNNGSEQGHSHEQAKTLHGTEDMHDHEQGAKGDKPASEEAHQAGITLSPEKMALAKIKVSALAAKTYAKSLYAPGEIKVNGYTSYIVSPRTESVVVSRHATLGKHVEKGQALVTLFSESIAEAQAKYRIAHSDWQRAKKLGVSAVSESSLLKSETDYDAALGRLMAFGLTEKAIKDIIRNGSLKLGEYTLVAKRAGAVLSDDFAQGQRVAAGDKIMVLTNEESLWVEARISPNKNLHLPAGTPAKVEFAGQSHDAKVIQEAHTIDPVTRTRIVRLLVQNKNDTLHSGMFVNVHFQLGGREPVIAVPETALVRGSDGDWMVFVEDHPGEFAAAVVELGQALGDHREILGLAANTRVVTEGAFFVASELAKGGFDPHNH